MNHYEIKSILVPLDLSECALKALDAAVQVAKWSGADLHLLYVTELWTQLHQASSVNGVNSMLAPEHIIQALASSILHTHGIKPYILFG